MSLKNIFSVEGKTVVVTGGSRGIGEMIAEGFVDNGAKVYITARKAEACDATAARLSEKGTCISLPGDLSKMEDIEAFVSKIEGKEEKLDILVNNAGAAWGAPLEEFPESGWDKVMNVNLKAIFFLTRRFLPLLRKAATPEDPARVINIGSIDALHVPTIENYSYSAAKAGVHHMTRVLATKLAPEDITVNAIAPGPFQSHMMAATLEAFGDNIRETNPRKRIGTPEDIAGTTIFLSSRAGAYTTGAVIPVDGGISTTL